MGRSIAIVFVVLLVACTGEEAALRVDLLTDYVPGIEAATAEVRLTHEDGTIETRTLDLGGSNLIDGVRIGEFELVRGSYSATVTLRRRSRMVLAERNVRVALRGDTAVTVLITRSCAGVVCPQAGDDPAAVECVGGRCVQPACTPETPEACPSPVCPEVACSMGAACAIAQCIAGACLQAADDAQCPGGQYCDPDRGCTSWPRARFVSSCSGGAPVSPSLLSSRQLRDPVLRIDNVSLLSRQRFSTQIWQSTRSTPGGAEFTDWSSAFTGAADLTFVDLGGEEFAAAALEPEPRSLLWCPPPFSIDTCLPMSIFDSEGPFLDDHDGPSLAVLDGELVMTISRGERIYLARPRSEDRLTWDAEQVDVGALLLDDPVLSDDGWFLVADATDGRVYALVYDADLDTYVDPRPMPNVVGGSAEIGVETADGFELFVVHTTRGFSEPHRWTCTYE